MHTIYRILLNIIYRHNSNESYRKLIMSPNLDFKGIPEERTTLDQFCEIYFPKRMIPEKNCSDDLLIIVYLLVYQKVI